MAHQVNVVSLRTEKSETPAVTLDNFDIDLMDLTPLETNVNPVTNMPSKICKISYNDKPYFRVRLHNVHGRLMRFGNDNDYSYQIALTMDEQHNEMFSSINNKEFDILKRKSKEYYGKTKTAPLLKKLYSSYPRYGREDQKLIENGEDPKYSPSLWLKVYFRADKDGLGDKFRNKATGAVITDPNQICNQDLTFSELVIYNKHIWFGEKTSTNFSVAEAQLDYEVESYDMDSQPLVSHSEASSSSVNVRNDTSDNEDAEVSNSSEEDDEEDD